MIRELEDKLADSEAEKAKLEERVSELEEELKKAVANKNKDRLMIGRLTAEVNGLNIMVDEAKKAMVEANQQIAIHS